MPTDLTEAAKDVINKFNAQRYDDLKPYLEYNVVLKRVIHPESVDGADNAIHYLNNHMKNRKAHLENWWGTLVSVYQDPTDLTKGEVSGTGDYYDDNDATATPIFFTLGFVRSDATDQWSLINSFATPTGPMVPGRDNLGNPIPTQPQWRMK